MWYLSLCSARFSIPTWYGTEILHRISAAKPVHRYVDTTYWCDFTSGTKRRTMTPTVSLMTPTVSLNPTRTTRMPVCGTSRHSMFPPPGIHWQKTNLLSLHSQNSIPDLKTSEGHSQNTANITSHCCSRMPSTNSATGLT
jgi:hypothetical protein